VSSSDLRVLSRQCQRALTVALLITMFSAFARGVRTVALGGLSLTPYRVIPHRRYEAIDEGRDPYLQQLRQGTKAPALLELRVGAQVV
jgi:hypothetical protein